MGSIGESEDGSQVDDFRKTLITSWESTSDDSIADEGAEARSPPLVSEKKVSENDNSSHRLWSMVGNEEFSGGPDMFNQVIAAVDGNALRKSDEDTLIILLLSTIQLMLLVCGESWRGMGRHAP